MSNSTFTTRKFVLLLLAICLPLTLAVVLQYGGFKDVESTLKENVTIDERILLLSRLKSNLGYGGAIHVFKNYLLRHEEQYLTKGEQAFSEFKVVLEDYREVKGVTQEELARIRVIEQTMLKYQEAFSTVQSLYGQGKTIKEIDATVRIDDAAAVTAFGELNSMLHERKNSRSEIARKALRQSMIYTVSMFAIAIVITAVFLTLFSGLLAQRDGPTDAVGARIGHPVARE